MRANKLIGRWDVAVFNPALERNYRTMGSRITVKASNSRAGNFDLTNVGRTSRQCGAVGSPQSNCMDGCDAICIAVAKGAPAYQRGHEDC